MAMNMKETYPCPEFQGARNEKLWTLLHTFSKVDAVLTHDVIHDKSDGDFIHVVGKRFADTVVHIDLSRVTD